MATEIGSNLVFLGIALLGIRYWGLVGVGIAFFGLYVFYTGLMAFVARRLSNFYWTRESIILFGWSLPIVLLGFLISFWKLSTFAMLINLTLAFIVGLYSLRSLYLLAGPERVQVYIQRFRDKRDWKDA